MRDLFREYRQGKITWDEAYATANNIAATTSSIPGTRDEEIEWWASQMDSLGQDAAEHLMKLLGYTEDTMGVYTKP